MDPTLRDRLRAANARCSGFPEVSHNADGTVTVDTRAYVALLDLRSLVPEIDSALWKLEELEKRDAEFVAIKREVME